MMLLLFFILQDCTCCILVSKFNSYFVCLKINVRNQRDMRTARFNIRIFFFLSKSILCTFYDNLSRDSRPISRDVRVVFSV